MSFQWTVVKATCCHNISLRYIIYPVLSAAINWWHTNSYSVWHLQRKYWEKNVKLKNKLDNIFNLIDIYFQYECMLIPCHLCALMYFIRYAINSTTLESLLLIIIAQNTKCGKLNIKFSSPYNFLQFLKCPIFVHLRHQSTHLTPKTSTLLSLSLHKNNNAVILYWFILYHLMDLFVSFSW